MLLRVRVTEVPAAPVCQMPLGSLYQTALYENSLHAKALYGTPLQEAVIIDGLLAASCLVRHAV